MDRLFPSWMHSEMEEAHVHGHVRITRILSEKFVYEKCLSSLSCLIFDILNP